MITVTVARWIRPIDCAPMSKNPVLTEVAEPIVALVWEPDSDLSDVILLSQQVAMVTAEKMKEIGWGVVVKGE